MRPNPLSLVLLSGLLIGCTGGDGTSTEDDETAARSVADPVPVAQAVLVGPDGAPHGTVTFREYDGTVEVDIDVENVPPGTHGIHLHETGDCSADDFASAGDHFAPADSRHGDPDAAEHHAGDFGNVEVGDARSGTKVLRSDALTISDGPRSVVGRAVILHDQADDLSSQPSGAAGARIACGEVRLIASEEHALRGDPAVHY